MKLKTIEHMETLFNYEGPVNPLLIEPKIGIAYQAEELWTEVLESLNRWRLAEGIALLEALKISRSDMRLDCLHLQVEVYFSQDCYETAWMLLDQIIRIEPQDKQALVLTIVLAHILKSDSEKLERVDALSKLDALLAQQVQALLTWIESHNTRTDFELDLENVTNIDALLVYGYGLSDDGQVPFLLEMRLIKTLELAERFPEANIIVSGGAVSNEHNESYAMRDYLIQKGLDPQRIVIEPLAKDTVGNSLMITNLLLEQIESYQNCVVVTSLGHLARSWLSMKAALSRYPEKTASLNLFAAAYEAPGTYPVPQSEINMSYTTSFRALGIFEDI